MVAVLREHPAGPETLLIQRSERPEDPGSGQVAFPGGRRDPADGSLLETALRELREEVGLEPEWLAAEPRFVDVFPASAFGLDVAVFVASLGEDPEPRLTVDPVEVASTFWLPRGELERTQSVPRSTQIGTIEVEATVHEGHVLWGFTLRVLRELFERLERPGTSAPDRKFGSPHI